MFDKSQNLFALIARVLMAALFLPAGISKIAGFAGTCLLYTSDAADEMD
jgi:putative oxidoreductase